MQDRGSGGRCQSTGTCSASLCRPARTGSWLAIAPQPSWSWAQAWADRPSRKEPPWFWNLARPRHTFSASLPWRPFQVAASMAADAHSPGKRIGAQLQVHHLAHHAFVAFQMKWRAGAVRGPEAPSFPARIQIIDPPIQALGEEAHRVGNAQAYKPSVH